MTEAKSKHTPGPWHVVFEENGDVRSIEARPPEGIVAEVNYSLSDVNYDETEWAKMVADFRLMAAAPDLLAACEAALAALAPSFDRLDHASLAEAENALRAAIAKAKGDL